MYAKPIFFFETPVEMAHMKKNIQQAFLINEKIGILLKITL